MGADDSRRDVVDHVAGRHAARVTVPRIAARTIASTVVILVALLASRAALAHTPPPYGGPVRAEPGSAILEVAPWLGVGGGASEVGERNRGLVEVSLDIGATLRLSNELRVGLWANARTASFQTIEPVGGLRFTWAPEVVHWFGVDGRWTIALDAGAGYAWRDAATFGVRDAAVFAARASWGYTAPLRLVPAYPWECDDDTDGYEPPRECTPAVGMVSGFRLYVAARTSADQWELTAGLEFEVFGAAWLFMWLAG